MQIPATFSVPQRPHITKGAGIQWFLRQLQQLETKGSRPHLTGTLGAFLNQPQSFWGIAICLAAEAHQRPQPCCYSLIKSVDTAGWRVVHYQGCVSLSLRGHAHHLHKLTSKTLGQAAFKKKLQGGHYHH